MINEDILSYQSTLQSTSKMCSISKQLHMVFFPFMAHGHMIPAIDMAKLFALHGVKVTVVTTPLNVPCVSKSIQTYRFEVGIKTIKFPSAEAGLPQGCETLDSQGVEIQGMLGKFLLDTTMMQLPFEELLQEIKPDCIVADMFFPWTTESAAKFGIPRLVFHGTSFISLCVNESLRVYQPYKDVSSDTEDFTVPNLPHEFKLTTMQLPDFIRDSVENDFTRLMKLIKESELKSFGVVVNSFYELESSYADHYRNFMGRKAWHVGPVSVCNRNLEDKGYRGKEASIDQHECLKWLDSKKPNSVVYICFGSMANFKGDQLKELAMGLEVSGQQFIWVVRKGKEDVNEEWLPQGFEERMEGKGLIIRGWAPQVLILEHESVGGFVTHCGWNSTIEGISAGVPMVTWPIAAEQFYNQNLVTQILKVGVAVGVKKWVRQCGDFVGKEAVEMAVTRLMMGEEAGEIRSRAKSLGEMARRAVEEGGSSYADLDALINELTFRKKTMSIM